MEQVLALPPTDTSNDAFVREVDEEYRRAQIVGIWKNYGAIIIGGIVVALLVVGGIIFYRSLTDGAAGSQGRRLDQAMREVAEKQEASAAPELRKLATDSNPGYTAMARFAEAELLFAKKDVKGAAARYAEISSDTSLPQPYRDRAVVQQTMIEYDTMKPEAVIDRLKSLAVPESSWFGSAGEMVAAAYLKLGKRDQAAKLYGQLVQSTGFVPDNIRERAREMAGSLGVDATKPTEEKKAQ
jgi:hypothetical protein